MPDGLAFADAAGFEAWLREHGESESEVWLRFAKKGTGVATVTYDEALDLALCFGWIDGQTRSLDETYYLQRWTPRKARSSWSKRNVAKVEGLVAAGRMQPAGLRQVEAAKADGRWDAAYDGARTIEVPDDLRRALDADPDAAAAFETLSSQNRYSILWRIQTVKRPETRERKIREYVAMLAEGRTLHP